MSFKSSLPPPRAVVSRLAKKAAPVRAVPEASSAAASGPPPYGKRAGFVPRTASDFGDGGAFPEIHVAQYPLDMGKQGKSTNSMNVVLGADGSIEYDSVVKQGGGHKWSKARDLVPVGERELVNLERPDEDTEAATAERTKRAIEKLQGQQGAADALPDGQFVRYTPTTLDGPGVTRVVKVVTRQEDPMEPAKHKHKRVPRGPPPAPPTVMHSPTRKLTKEDQEAWNIPPAISNWKNPNGYTIPLDKRLAADGRGLQDHTINDRFAHFAEALYLAGENAREEVARRAEIRKEELVAERESKEREMQEMAKQTRAEKERIEAMSRAPPPSRTRRSRSRSRSRSDDDADDEHLGRAERDRIREERRRERERQRRMESARSGGKPLRDEDRDVSERIALGERVPISKDTMFDQRLFNQSGGMQHGHYQDEEYNIYDKPLFNAGSSAALFKAPPSTSAGLVGDDGAAPDMEKLMDTSRFRPDRGFAGAEREAKTGPRTEPVQFHKEPEGDLLAGLDDFLASAKSSSSKRSKTGE